MYVPDCLTVEGLLPGQKEKKKCIGLISGVVVEGLVVGAESGLLKPLPLGVSGGLDLLDRSPRSSIWSLELDELILQDSRQL